MSFDSVVKKIPRKGIVSQMPTPNEQGISDSKWIWKLMGDVPITKSYAEYLLTGPPMGTKKTYPAGYCLNKGLLNAKKRTITIDTKPSGKLNIPGINPDAFGPIKDMRGLIPGVLNDMYDINPVELWSNIEGSGPVVKDCFTNYSKIKKSINTKKNWYQIILIIILIFIYISYNFIQFII